MPSPLIATSLEHIANLAKVLADPSGRAKLESLAEQEAEARGTIVRAEALKAEIADGQRQLASLKERLEGLPAEETRVKSEAAARSAALDTREHDIAVREAAVLKAEQELATRKSHLEGVFAQKATDIQTREENHAANASALSQREAAHNSWVDELMTVLGKKPA